MQKTDLAKDLKHYYKAKAMPELVTIAPADFLAIEGAGDPNGPLFAAKVKAMYTVAYTIKKICKLQGNDFKVPCFEGYWWSQSGKQVVDVPVDEWNWKLVMQMPGFVTIYEFRQAVALAGNKMSAHPGELKFERLPGTMAVQILHTGSYHEETANIMKLLEYVAQHHLEVSGLHHEIYLNNPSRVSTEKLKTILRMDVRKK
jgi:hypothetical protein